MTDVITAQVPGAPTGLSVTSVTTTSIAYSWTNPTCSPWGQAGCGITNDTLLSKQTTGGSWTGHSLGVATTYTFSSLTTDVDYCVLVEAVNATGQGAPTSTLCQVTASIPTAPTGFSAGSVTLSSITWSWTLPTGETLTNVTLLTKTTTSGSWTGHSLGASATSNVQSGLSTDVNYCALVEAVNATGQGTPTATVCQVTASVPTAPTGFSAGSVTQTSITWSWTLPTGETLTNVTLLTKTTVGGSWTGHSLGSSAVSYAQNSLATDVNYCALVEAVNATGQGTPTSVVCQVTATVPAAPSSVTATADTGSQTSITVSWVNPGGGGLTDDKILQYSGQVCSGSPTTIDLGSVSASDDVTGLAVDATYSFTVTAVNATGSSTASSCAWATTNSLPAAPTAFSVATTTYDSVTVGWANPVTGGLTGNEIYDATSCSGFTTTAISVSTSYTIPGLASATGYDVEVAATNATGTGAPTSCIVGTTLPVAPTALSSSSPTTSALTWSWTQPSGSVTDDLFFWQAGSTCSSATEVDLGGVSTSYTLSGISPDSEFCAYVEADSAGGAGAPTATATGWTIPNAPSALTLESDTAASADLGWTAPSGAPINYTLYVATSCSASSWTAYGGTGTSDNVAGLSQLTFYCAQATAWSSGGQSADSNQVSFTTPRGTPGQPANLSLIAETTSTLTLSWGNWPGPNTNVTLFYAKGSCLTAISYTGVSLGVVSTTTITNLPQGTTFAAIVVDWNNSGEGVPSNCLTVTTDPITPPGGCGSGGCPGGIIGGGTNNSLFDSFVNQWYVWALLAVVFLVIAYFTLVPSKKERMNRKGGS